ncbi:hypothetical protein V6N13_107588 [Hibiscus sabdariffa]
MEKATRKSEPPVEERFGPWMQVVSRKRRPGALRRGSLPDNSGIELGGSKTETRVKMATAVSRGKRPVVVKSVERSGSVGLAKDRNVQPGLHGVVAAKGKVIQVPYVLQSEKHVAVQIVDDGSSSALKESNVVSKSLPRKDARAKKKDDQNRNQTEVTEWAAQLSKSLDMDGMTRKSNVLPNDTSPGTHDDNEVQWIENSTFEGDLQLNLQ